MQNSDIMQPFNRMEPFRIKNVQFGQGMPKICVPLTGATREDLLEEADCLFASGADLAEWRADFLQVSDDIPFGDGPAFGTHRKQITDTLSELRRLTAEMPLLFTYRSRAEGGNRELPEDVYFGLNLAVIESGNADLVDLEFSRDHDQIGELIHKAKKAGVKVILSHHIFKKTPTKEEMLDILLKMQDFGAHITKLAVMAQCPEDVLRLLEVSLAMKERHANVPFITISMGEMGILSRISGSQFGSAITWGAARNPSAPGQIKAEELRRIQEVLK